MAGKKLTGIGIAPNLLLKDVENAAPFLFKKQISTAEKSRQYLEKLCFYKKNLKLLQNIDLAEYFYLCLAAHWSTAGTFVPTNVDNQIRESLWRHEWVDKYIETMGRMTIESWSWDYSPMTNRKAYNPKNQQVLSTHEGTWLSVAIGAYNALYKKRRALADEVADVILAEVDKEEKMMLELREARDHINFLRACALIAHNFGDLDRVIEQWEMPEDNAFRKRIFKLAHQKNEAYPSSILPYAGQVNKRFLAVENHRHMSLRQPKALRRSAHFLVPIGPFMDEWGVTLGKCQELSSAEKGEIVAAFFEGFKRQDQAFGYARAYHGLMSALPRGLESLEPYIAFDVVAEIKKSKFLLIAQKDKDTFLDEYRAELENFQCPVTNLKF